MTKGAILKKIFSFVILFWFLVSCKNKVATENGIPDNKVATQSDTLDEKVAKEIKAIFRAETCKITRSEEVVIIKSLFTEQSFKEEDASVIAFAFYRLSLSNKLKPYDIIKVVLTDNYGTEYKFRFSEFKEKAECFETVEKIGLLLFDRKYSELKKHMDSSQGDAEADRAIKLFRKADSISGKIDNFAIISIHFATTITRIDVKANHVSNSSTYYSFGFNKKTNKLKYVDVNESNPIPGTYK
jgi:hypothetical protein